MNTLKKIGLTALAGSLVATSVFAGEMSVSGSASVTAEGYTGENLLGGTAFSMGNQLDFAGSGELDNGMTVSVAMTIDQNDDSTAAGAAYTGGPFDSHSVTVSSDAMGTFKFSGEGGSSAQSALDTTAAGDMWDNFDGKVTSGATVTASTAGDNSMMYTLPSMVDGLSISGSYAPQGTGSESSVAYAATYTGVEGLSVSWGTGETNTGVATTTGDTDTMKASYAYGSVTVAYSNTEHSNGTATSNQDVTSMNVAYTVSDAISVSYGTEELDSNNSTTDAEYSGISASYTAGGMTITANRQSADNIAYGTASTEDMDYWSLGLSFAF